MTIYLAGPMSNVPFFNFPAFFAAAEQLRKMGHVVLSPAEHDRDELGLDYTQFPHGSFSDAGWSEDRIGHFMRRALTWDIAAVCRSQAIALLPGWQQSRGANVEHGAAQMLGLEVMIL